MPSGSSRENCASSELIQNPNVILDSCTAACCTFWYTIGADGAPNQNPSRLNRAAISVNDMDRASVICASLGVQDRGVKSTSSDRMATSPVATDVCHAFLMPLAVAYPAGSSSDPTCRSG